MIDGRLLLTDLQRVVKWLEKDLREQAETLPEVGSPLREEYERAFRSRRTAATWASWRDDRVTMAAVAWVLGTVFVRFCEDNGLLSTPSLTGPTPERMALAEDAQAAYFQTNPSHTDRDWILAGFEAIGSTQAGRLLFDPRHNPAYQIPVSHDGAKQLIAFWRRRGEEGSLIHDFTDESWDTRFLGDLYQDLSQYAKKTYALLQTPVFVEEFILERTMKPALDEFGLEGFRMIDPACGSGHFLLGAFRRLIKAWEEQAPAKDVYERTRLALESVHGVDINPYAVAIARYRLLLAAMRVCDIQTLAKTEGLSFPVQIAIGDSLLMGGRQLLLPDDEDLFTDFIYATEDVHEFPMLLAEGSYHLVVGNPPYITAKDRSINALYRSHYRETCIGQYSLTVPFAQRFFELAANGGIDGRGAGYVGKITSNAFMKREFGEQLILRFFANEIDLTEVIDTSGAYIPGHGTPTVILIGRRRRHGRGATVRAVRGVRGEPKTPNDASAGKVWSAIAAQIDRPGSVSEWVSVGGLDRKRYFDRFPWILQDGGLELIEHLEIASVQYLSNHLSRKIGFASFPGQDEAFIAPERWFTRQRIEVTLHRPLIIGERVRDWVFRHEDHALAPYDQQQSPTPVALDEPWGRHLWALRQILLSTTGFEGERRGDSGEPWWTWYRWVADRYRTPLSITFAFVATHNHFVLDRGGKVFKQSAPVIKLPEGATEDDHLRLLGLLNSSTACFWLKQVSYPKGGDPIGDEGARVSAEAWSDRYEFTGTRLEQFPVPERVPLELARELHRLAQELSATSPDAVCRTGAPTRLGLTEARARWQSIRRRMIALQEELDWECYGHYGIVGGDVCAPLDALPELKLGERAFEIVLARKIAQGEVETQWFVRHGSTPITEVPKHWPEAYRRTVERRIALIESNRYLALIERPECKRRWTTPGWDVLEKEALKEWLLDRLEHRDLWHEPGEHGDELPRTLSAYQLADRMRGNQEFRTAVELYTGRRDPDLASVVVDLVAEEHVPYLAALRYRETGLVKRADWEEVWELQRREDSGQTLDGPVPVPPKYTIADFQRNSYWRHRGKLDVPKERFISYPYANRDGDPSILLGWAGWDHAEQAQALATLIVRRRDEDAWRADRLTPLLTGVREVLPWVRQWHAEVDPRYGQRPAEIYGAFLDAETNRLHLTEADLTRWRAPTKRKNER